MVGWLGWLCWWAGGMFNWLVGGLVDWWVGGLVGWVGLVGLVGCWLVGRWLVGLVGWLNPIALVIAKRVPLGRMMGAQNKKGTRTTEYIIKITYKMVHRAA